MAKGPLIVGLGGTVRSGSSTELALRVALKRAEQLGAEIQILGGAFLATLPVLDPNERSATHQQKQLVETVRNANGLIIATPGYHGSPSGVIKNALDTLEFTRQDERPYLQGRPVGTIVTADGSQAAGTTLMTLRANVHALRGWPTPFGATLSGGSKMFDETGACRDPKDARRLAAVAEQVLEFVLGRALTLEEVRN
jgi:FMN reductase